MARVCARCVKRMARKGMVLCGRCAEIEAPKGWRYAPKTGQGSENPAWVEANIRRAQRIQREIAARGR